jgi:platelet-activating factor acetylhydrolase
LLKSSPVKSGHESFSDFPLLPLVRNSAAVKFMDITSTLCLAFLDGELQEELDKLVTRKMMVLVVSDKKDKYGDPKRTLEGDVGDVVVH